MANALKHGIDKIEERDRYLAMLSHDMRSALASVIGSLSQASEGGLDPTAARHVEAALTAAADATRLLDGILDIESFGSDRFELQLEATGCAEFLGDLDRRWRDRCADKGIGFEAFCDPSVPPRIVFDRNRLARAAGNLIENAIKYTDRGTVNVSFGMAGPDMLSLSVRDQGPGFSRAALERLYAYRGRPEEADRPGSGLGLHIAKWLVDQMNGSIDVANEAVGARVEIRLPVTVADDKGALAIHPSSQLPDLSGVDILLAEDNTTNQAVVTKMLSAMGASFTVASDGVEALARFREKPYDLLLLDIEMPRKSGLAVIREVRQTEGPAGRTPIVALTAYAMREHRQRIAEAGADGMIAKPILGIEEFGASLQRHLGRARPRAKPDAERAATPIDGVAFAALKGSIGPEMMAELMGKVAKDLADVRKGLESGVETGDMEAIHRTSHVLISVAGAIGATGVQARAEALNRAAHADAANVRELAAECLTGIDDILSVVTDPEFS